MYNNNVASTITAQGRDLTRTMHRVNEEYWYNQWHLDTELHKNVCVKNIRKVNNDYIRRIGGDIVVDPTPEQLTGHDGDLPEVIRRVPVSIYADTDSLFVSFDPAINHSDWKNLLFNREFLEGVSRKFIILNKNEECKIPQFSNSNYLGEFKSTDELPEGYEMVIVEGMFIHDWKFFKWYQGLECKKFWNWNRELDYIMGLDKFRYGGYFKKCLEEYAASFGVENKEDFELERVSESIINIAKKKYIQHVAYEDGVPYDRLSYFYPKGVELVRSSTPAFAREKIVDIVKYLFSHPDDFNAKDLIKYVKKLRKEFELADIDDIALQSSCSNYSDKVLDDKDSLRFVDGAHMGVKGSAFHNFLLNKNHGLKDKYEYVKSGKIKYYYCKSDILPYFAYIRGSHPLEFAPPVDYDTTFYKSIISPINSIISPLGLPEITQRLTVIMDIFS